MKTVFVVGSINADLVAFAERLPGAGETVLGNGFETLPGGKGANQAAGAAKAGAETSMIGAVGNDGNGQFMLAALKDSGIDVGHVSTVSGPTGVALIAVGGGDNQIVVVPGANHAIPAEAIGTFPIAENDILLTQMETTLENNKKAMEKAKRAGARVIFNPAPASIDALSLIPYVDVLVVNEHEAALLAQMPVSPEGLGDKIGSIAERIGLSDAQTLIVTIGAGGAVAFYDGKSIVVEGKAVVVVDTTGAGDCFCGYLAAGMAQGLSLNESMEIANKAASISVQSKGAAQSIPLRSDLLE